MEWIDKNSTALIAAVAALLSATLAGGFALLGAWLNNRQNNQRLEIQIQHEKGKENRKLFLEKGEELYVCLNAWILSAHAHLLTAQKLMMGQINQQQKRELLKDYADSQSFTRLQTLIPIYFPELDEGFSKARRNLLAANQAVDDYTKDKISLDKAKKSFVENDQNFDVLADKLKADLQAILLNRVKD